jgi:ABC-2 type transport system ATP-binding protein
LHLALIMAIDAKLLVLDEPTLGLDIIYRKQFYDTLLNDYFDGNRTIIVTTHQVEEIEQVLTDLMFINHGKIALNSSMEDIANHYVELMASAENAEAARRLNPVSERQVFGKSVMIFENVGREKLNGFGELRTPSIADLFVAKMSAPNTNSGRAAA